MSTWVGVEIDGLSVEDYQNHHENWFFKPSDRVRECCERDEYGLLPDNAFIGYRATAAQIRRRMNLQGFDLASCESHFNDCLDDVISALSWMLQYYKDNEHPSPGTLQDAGVYQIFLDTVKGTSLQDWINALPEALRLRNTEPRSLFSEVRWYNASNVPLVNAMLSDVPLYSEYSLTDLFNFPCINSAYFQLALLECCHDEALCELNIAPLIQSGYEEDFIDLEEIQLQETQPCRVSRLSIEEILSLSATQPLNASLQRMCYASIITAMESYLGDILKREISSRPAVKQRFVSSYPTFNERKFKLSEIFKWLEKLDDEIQGVLDELSLHKIETAKNIFHHSLLIEFPEESLPFLGAAVKRRHDIVHRNGRSTTGELLSIEHSTVGELSSLILSFIRYIDSQVLDGLLYDDEADLGNGSVTNNAQ